MVKIFLVGNFFFYHFEYITPCSLGLLVSEESADSTIPVPLYEKNHLFLLKILKFFVFRQFYYMSWRRTFWIEILR